VASNISYSFSEDGSTLKLVGNITRSNTPGFEAGKQIAVEIKIGSASIASVSTHASSIAIERTYAKGDVKSLVLHHK
jgi:hypothetical protein